LFGVASFEQLAERLRDEALEGLDESNVHRFYHALCLHLPVEGRPELSDEALREYDQHIFRHTQRLNEKRLTRGEPAIAWKYFQYLALLFTEIYLDRYFRDPEALLRSINAQAAAFNEGVDEADRVKLLDEGSEAWPQLNKLSLWMATGSGKTLLMHVNLLQYRSYLENRGRKRELNRILLLTPNEGLSEQHRREFKKAGVEAELFQKDGRGLFTGHAVEILDIHKLKEEMGEKTVAVDAFEGNNLVLIDEGHRGASSGETGTWMRFRNALCERGFSFEYSATFGQAVKGDATLTDLYAKSIVFDYSYRYFYGDGFGKDYQILNLDDDTEREHLDLYLTACLLAFFQQLRLFREQEADFRPFQLEKPLWIFVGSSVTKTLATRDASDIVEILQFLARFVAERRDSIERIERVLNQGLVTATGKNLFAGRFTFLNTANLSPEQVFEDVLATLFNAPGGGRLYVENLKGATGEIALRIGAANEAFGLINVGDDAKLVKLCDETGLETGDREFSGSLFHDINQPESTVNMLIGSKKFTEGWNSWRVATMGLMNVGRGEGAQIIQLFGRGVRLQGYSWCLKRSGRALLPQGVEPPKHIGVLETLSIFGIRADYMAKFRDFLEEEGVPSNEERIEFILPIIRNLGTQKLKTIRLKKTISGVSTEFGDAFRKLGPIPTLGPPTEYLQKNQVVLNWYPKIQALKSAGVPGRDEESAPHQAHFSARHVALLDWDALFFELERFKAERGWHNLNLTREANPSLLQNPSWYQLLIPEEELACDSFEKVRLWQEIATSLLKKYIERYYTFRKREWELPHLEYQDLSDDDPNLLVRETPGNGGYRILIEASQEEMVTKLAELRTAIERGKIKELEFGGFKTIWFGKHLYQPLLYLEGSAVEVSPVPLNKGERRFVEDLKSFHDANPKSFEGNEFYLLRNLSKGRGVGFFEAGNFHPDFILWLVADGRQYVSFVDPKGIRHLGPTDPKIQFHETIKEIEERLGDPGVVLESFIISNTPAHEMQRLWGIDKAAMAERHILFQKEDADSYLGAMFERTLVG
ncbi:MAG: DEAD/DEAH box helicase family protein, partial [Thermoanaerobaculia bacterium]